MWSLWLGDHVEEKPSAPAFRPARSRATIASISSWVASRLLASSCITTRRSALWPTENPAFGMSVPSRASRYSAVLVQFHGTPFCSDSSGMPSTRASIRMR